MIQTAKIVISKKYGEFKLSERQREEYHSNRCLPPIGHVEDCMNYEDVHRADPFLVKVIEKYPEDTPNLKIVEIPLGIQWGIEEYLGGEAIVERHRVWR